MRHAAIAWLLLAAQAVVRPAVPTDPISAILDAFQTHAVVALGEGDHGNEQIRAFFLALINDRRFPSTVNDILVEGGNAAYQDVVDRYVNGENVSDAEVRAAWENSTQTQIVLLAEHWAQGPAAVRALNARLPKERRLRLLLADPPIDWSLIHTYDDYQKVLALRDSFPADLIRREVVAKHRHALIVFGGMHLQRKQIFSNYDMSNPIAQTLVSWLEGGASPIKVFNVWTDMGTDLPALQSDAASWRAPAFALLRGTVLGRADFKQFYSTPRQAPPMPMENQFDALLYLGSKITFGQPVRDRCSDRAYMEAHYTRMAISDLPQSEIDRIKRVCANP
jgi:hypothetical protein